MSEPETHAHLPEIHLPPDAPRTDRPEVTSAWEAYSPEILEAILDP
jgi:hypothetical protein